MCGCARLGADYRIDLVSTTDEGSYGFRYDLIELETPHKQPFTKDGIPSEPLNRSLQQVRDWKRWIKECRAEAKNLFPSKVFSLFDSDNFGFTIIIGRRGLTQNEAEKRDQIAAAEDIQIRSYDYLTDRFQKRPYLDCSLLSSAEEDRLTVLQRNELANPFSKAFLDADWREFLRARPHISHMYANNIAILLKMRKYNAMMENFIALAKHIPEKAVEDSICNRARLRSQM